jgi:hypothetical protein
MRLAATMLVRDEEHILRAHLDYHLAQGVDLFLAMDNGSVDATPEILREYERAGAVRIIPGAEPGRYRQGEWVTRMARLAATEHGADWVLNLDADEFWWPRAGTLPDALAAVPDRYGVLHAARIDFGPAPDGEEPFWERMTVRRRVLRTPLGHRGLPRAAHRGHPGIEVVTGNHAAFAPDLLLAPPVDVIDALHYPTRSLAQLERKVAAHAENIRATPGLKPDIGEENISLDDRRRRGELAGYFAEQLIDEPARAAGLKDGSLVEDRRLAGFFAAGLERRAPQPAATQALSERFLDVEEWLGLQLAEPRAREAALERRLGDAASRIAALEAAYEATDEALQREREEHYRTAETLRLLRASRVLRAANRVRKLKPGS